MDQTWKLSPSDLTFLWDECPRCFYLKIVHNFNRPWGAFPKIFGRIDKLMKTYYGGRHTSEISGELPEGIVQFGEKWVTSLPISLSGHRSRCYIRGKFDTVVEFSDGTYGIVDFKTSEPSPKHVPFYSRQLHSYAYALENPAPGTFALRPVTRLGLLVVEPVDMFVNPDGKIAFLGDVTWLECPLDYEGYLGFLDNVLTVLEAPSPPPGNPGCGYCQYREAARSSEF